jgi:hypothetical protein
MAALTACGGDSPPAAPAYRAATAAVTAQASSMATLPARASPVATAATHCPPVQTTGLNQLLVSPRHQGSKSHSTT